MEIPDDQFVALWQEISDALVRIAAQISREKKTAWKKAIDDFRKDPLTADDDRNVQELERWYKNDMDVKKLVEELKTTHQEGIDRLETRVKDFQVKFEESSHMIERGAQCLETAVLQEAQDIKDIKDHLEEIHHGLIDRFISSVAGSRSTEVQLQNEYEDNERPGTQGRATGSSIISQEPQSVVQGATVTLIGSYQPQALITTVTDPSMMEIDEDNSDLLENQDTLKVNQITERFQQLRMELHNAFLQWIPIRGRTMEQLEGLATKLHKHHRNVNITIFAGASMGIVVSILSIADSIAIAAPFAIRAGITVLQCAGRLVFSVFHVVHEILETLGHKEVQAAIVEDRDACKGLQQQLDYLENFIFSQAEFFKPIFNEPVLLREFREDFDARFFRAVASAATRPCSWSEIATGVALGSTAFAVMRAAGVSDSVIKAVLLAADIAALVISLLELHRGSTSAAGEDIRRILNELECPDEEDVSCLVESFIDVKLSEEYIEVSRVRARNL